MKKSSKRTISSGNAVPLTELSQSRCRQIKYLFSDIDDTISLHGKIPKEAYSALWDAKDAGLKVIPITGRPAGWVDHLARMWPVDAVIGENGAFYYYLDPKQGRDGKLIRRFLQSESERKANKERLFNLFAKLKQSMPHLTLASDQLYREIDIAIDICEDVPALSDGEVEKIVNIYKNAGAQSKVSSIHVNSWFGSHDKFTTCSLFLKERYGVDFAAVKDKLVYFGDSPNDEPLFEKFPLSIGVANVTRYLPQMKHGPTYLTRKEGGLGFAEAVKYLLKS
jgi:HAD superfamily hydrolase (TIGR01484 family)